MGSSSETSALYAKSEHTTQAVITATRFWAHTPRDTSRLLSFLNCASKYSHKILVAINTDADRENTLHFLSTVQTTSQVSVIPVSPWGGVTHALNLLVHHCLTHHPSARYILFQSPEVVACQSHVTQLLHIFHHGAGNILVAGHALPGHPMYNVPADVTEASLARAAPWNTFAMWDVAMLGRVGFPAFADRVQPPGMEEVAAIAVIRRLFGGGCRMAFLVCGASVEWGTEFEGERSVAHKRKMESKLTRARAALRAIGVDGEDDEHFVCLVHCAKDC